MSENEIESQICYHNFLNLYSITTSMHVDCLSFTKGRDSLGRQVMCNVHSQSRNRGNLELQYFP